MARAKAKDEQETGGVAEQQVGQLFAAFDALMATAAVDSQIAALAESGADHATLQAAMNEAWRTAQERWGLGLHHLQHTLELTDAQDDLILQADGREVSRFSAGYEALARAYAGMQATGDQGLSEWGALGEGHRVSADLPFSQLKVLIEEARDFETQWMPGRGELFHRVWRKGETLFVEVMRPVSPQAALSDAAWDVITSIKDRAFQRELMRRSEEVGMLGALLAARHAGAGANLARLPEAHFAVQAVVERLTGADARSPEGYRAALKLATAQLEEAQGYITGQLSEVLRRGLSN